MLVLKNRNLTYTQTYKWLKKMEHIPALKNRYCKKKTNICSHKKLLALKNRNLDRYLTYPQTYTRTKKSIFKCGYMFEKSIFDIPPNIYVL